MLSLIILAIILILEIFTLKKKKLKKSSKLATSAMTLIVLGIIFGEDRLIGYSLIGVGILLSIIDLIKNLKRKK
jgi:hypothetical protein